MRKYLGALLAVSLMLTGCQTNGRQIDATFDPSVYLDYVTKDQPITSLNYLVTDEDQNLKLLGNVVEGLVEENNYGAIVPALATDIGRSKEQGKVWEFTIKEGNFWVDSRGQSTNIPVTAHDFVFGLKYALKNNSGYRQQLTSLIEGADKFIAGNEGFLGVEAVDDYTLRYTLKQPCSYFNSYLLNGAFYPLNQELFEGVEGEFASGADHLFYNGPYYLSLYNKEKAEYTKNPLYWDMASVSFDKGQVSTLEDDDHAFEWFEKGKLSYSYLSDTYAMSHLNSIDQHAFMSNSDDDTLALVFNFNTKNKDAQKALANDHFRKAIYHGLNPNPTSVQTEEDTNKMINVSVQSTLTPVSFLQTSQADDYVTLGSLSVVSSQSNYNQEQSDLHANKAIEELTEAKVTLPLEIRIPMDVSKPQIKAQLEQAIAGINSNLMTFRLVDYEEVDERSDLPQLTALVNDNAYEMMLVNVRAEYGDPSSILQAFTKDGIMNATYSHLNDDAYNMLYTRANTINDQDKRLMAFAECESYLLQKAYAIPFSHGHPKYKVTSINDFTMPSGLYGLARYKLKNITALDACVTITERQELKTAYEANKING